MITDGDRAQVQLLWDKRFVPKCPGCDQPIRINRKTRQSAMDMTLASADFVGILYEAVQGYCRSCGRYHTARPLEIIEGHAATIFRSDLPEYMSAKNRFHSSGVRNAARNPSRMERMHSVSDEMRGSAMMSCRISTWSSVIALSREHEGSPRRERSSELNNPLESHVSQAS